MDQRLLVFAGLLALVGSAAGPAAATPGAKKRSFSPPPSVAAPPPHATRTSSGLAFLVLRQAPRGARKPKQHDLVTIHFTVWKTNGQLYYSTHQRKRPLTLRLDSAPPGWREAVMMMRVGGRRRFWMPPHLGFKKGARLAQMLVYEIELLVVKPAQQAAGAKRPPATAKPATPTARNRRAPPVPANVAKPPANAHKTRLGVAYVVLRPGTGTRKPRRTDKVEVHYTGWTTNGHMFDSSLTRGNPATFPLNRVIPGWTDCVGDMVVGEIRRMWIPERLAYRGNPHRPQGTLVFEVHLLAIK